MRRGLRSFCLTLAVCATMAAVAAPALAQLAPSEPTPTSEEEEAPDEQLPWRGSSFGFSQLLAASSLSKNSELSYDPYYAFRFEIELQWHFTRAVHISVWQALDIELTDSNTTTRRQQPLLLDTMLRLDAALWQHGSTLTPDAVIVAGPTLVAPTSLASQAATMIIGTGAHVAGNLSFAQVLKGAGVGLDGSYLRRFTESTTVRTAVPYPCFFGDNSGQQCTQLGGPSNVRDIFTLTLSAHLELSERLALSVAAASWWRQGYELSSACVTTLTGQTCLGDQSTTHWRDIRILRAGLGYHAYDWLGLTLLVANFWAERSPDGSLRMPLRSFDTFFGLSAELAFDKLYLAARGKAAGTQPPAKP